MTLRTSRIIQTLRLSIVVGALLLSSGAVAASRFAYNPIRLTVIGDSLSSGFRTPGDPWTKDAQEMLRLNGQDIHIDNAAENGAGYVTRGERGGDFLAQVNQAVDDRSQVVLVFGSDNDLGQPHLAAAIATTLDRVKAISPRATLIVVGPPAPPADPPRSLQGIRDALRAATQHIDGQFVDPLSLKWFQGRDSRFVSADAEHPNSSGEQYLARRMTAILTPTLTRLSSLSKQAV